MKELSECDDINATIIDLGSSKKKIADNIPSNIRQNVVLAHPMTGTEYTGPKAALKGLYTEKVVALCDTQNSATEHNQVAISLFSSLRMRIIHMDSADHDLHAAYISHLPHIISFSLANTVLDHENRTSILDLAATGFRDMSRLAKSSPIMWEDIFRQNKNNLLHTLDEFEKNLKMFKENLKKDNWQEISQLMNNANTLHEVFK
jgi:prephenate dehydrogenase